jgi:hypothetical protein
VAENWLERSGLTLKLDGRPERQIAIAGTGGGETGHFQPDPIVADRSFREPNGRALTAAIRGALER